MCGIVNTAFHSQINSPSFNPTPRPDKPDILWKDDNFTVYRETANPVSSIVHVIIAFKSVLAIDILPFSADSRLFFPSANSLHVPSIYRLVSFARIHRIGTTRLNMGRRKVIHRSPSPTECQGARRPLPQLLPYLRHPTHTFLTQAALPL